MDEETFVIFYGAEAHGVQHELCGGGLVWVRLNDGRRALFCDWDDMVVAEEEVEDA